MSNLPNDPMILLSYINTQLRDNFSSLDELCQSLGVEKADIEAKLNTIDYSYNPALNKFV
jgi:biotin operon repressor